MMYEDELVSDRDEEVSTRVFPGRRVHEFSILDCSDNYKFTKLEVLATLVIMLSTISGGFLEGYSSPVVSSLLDSKVSTAVIHQFKTNRSDNQENDSYVETVTEFTLPNTTTLLNISAMINSTLPFTKTINYNDTYILNDNETNILNGTETSNDTFLKVNNETTTAKGSSSHNIHNISLHFSMEQASWFGSLLLLGAFMGALMSSVVIKFGRRHAILLSSLPRFIGWLFIIVAPSMFAINFGRFLTGVSIGMVTSAGPIYISEITHSSKRGAFGCFIQLGVNLGIFLAAVLGAVLAWKSLAVCGAISVVVYLIPTFNIPNSPYWLVVQGRNDDAKTTLKRMRPDDYPIEEELTQIKAIAQNMKQNKSISWEELFKERRSVLPLMLVLLVTAVNRFSGYNAVISYCSTFLHHAVPTISPNWTAVAVCFIQVLATIASIGLVDVWGRRKLLLSSIAVMAVSLISIALSDTFSKYGSPWVAVLSTMLYVAAYSIGLGPITLVILGEMLPLDARDKASAVVATVNWLAAFVVTKTFFSLESVVGFNGVCGIYSLVCILGGFLVYVLIPETKGRTLSEIEAHFSYSQSKFYTRQKMDGTISNIVDHEFATIDSYSTFT